MRYTYMLMMAAFAVAAAFLTSEALAQWSDGGPEMYPLTYPMETTTVKADLRVADVPDTTVQTFEALALWSDGGPEMYPLTYPPEMMRVETDSRIVEAPCDAVEPVVTIARWSDGGPEMYPLTYPPETTAMNDELCLAKPSETQRDMILSQSTMW